MILDALKFLTEVISKAETPKRIEVADPRRLFLAVGGEVEQHELPPPPRNHNVGTLTEIIALANRFADEGSKPVVWYDGDKVILVIDDDGHRVERATLVLEVSDIFVCLIHLQQTKPWLDQKTAIRLMRIDLGSTVPPATLLDRLRKIKIENGQAVTSQVRHGQESMGRSINAAVSGEGDIPEGVVLEVPVYKTPGEADERYSLGCSVEIEPSRLDFFRLMPLPDEIDRVQALAVASIGNRLTEGLNDGVFHYHGRP